MDQAAVWTKRLTKRYGHLVAVDALDLEIRKGEVFGLLGPNGAGKTTTILMLLGLSEPADGQARVAGLDPVREPIAVKRVCGYLPDNVGFYNDLTGRENLRYTARLNGLPRAQIDHRVAALITQVGLDDAADRDVGEYSKGMRQRLGIADALVKDPQVLVLDEPTIGLDPEGAQETLRLIRDLARSRGVTVLLSSHLLHQVQATCDRMAIFVKGKIIAIGTLEELAGRLEGGRVVVEVGAPDATENRDLLLSVPGVVRVDREGELFLVSADRDTREAIGRAFLARGVVVTHLRRQGAELDEVYRLYFEESAGVVR
jgi:ABC-2 type transport system ATP-binding protein